MTARHRPGLVGAQYLAPEARARVAAIAGAPGGGPAPGEEVVFRPRTAPSLSRAKCVPLPNGLAPCDGAVPRKGGGGPASEFDRGWPQRPCPCGSGKKSSSCTGKFGPFRGPLGPARRLARRPHISISRRPESAWWSWSRVVRPRLWDDPERARRSAEYAAHEGRRRFWTGRGQAPTLRSLPSWRRRRPTTLSPVELEAVGGLASDSACSSSAPCSPGTRRARRRCECTPRRGYRAQDWAESAAHYSVGWSAGGLPWR